MKRLKTEREKGAAAIEFALVLPLLVLLIFGIVEFARAYNVYLSVTHAAREGARLAAVDKFDVAEVEKRAYPLKISDGLRISDPVYPEGNLRGKPVEVTVSYLFQLNIPLWGNLAVNISSKGISRIE